MRSRILSRRASGAPDTAPGSPAETPAADGNVADPAPAEQATTVMPAATEEPLAPADAPPTPEEIAAVETGTPVAEITEAEVAAAVDPEADLPAGADAPPPPTPSFLSRGKLRRRLRYLRRVREIGFRDLGGLVLDLDRFGRDRPDLVELKLAGLKSIDAELRALEIALDDAPETEELFEPGISSCAACGSIHGSDARFCPSCGTPVGGAPAEPPAAAAETDPPPAA
ncbi:MAG: hypothetical protein ACJ762_18945 [Solirubrobacteraceae bacterium]